MATFEDLLNKERDRLTKLMDDIATRRATLDTEEAAIAKELKAITAYEAAKADKPKKAKTTRAPRSSSKRETIITMIQDHKEGMSRAELIEALGIKGNKAQEQSLSNTLANLKKAAKLTAKDGKYLAA